MNDPSHRGGIENPKDFQGGFVSEIRKQKIRNQKEIRKYFFNQYFRWDELQITIVLLKFSKI